MLIWNVTTEQLIDAVRAVSNEHYEGNVILRDHPTRKGRALRWTLRVKDSTEPGHRVSVGDMLFNPDRKPRRLPDACWHAHYDVMAELFRRHPDARIKSSKADYNGVREFTDKAMDSGDVNVGSQVKPVAFHEACECEDWYPKLAPCKLATRVYEEGGK